MNARPTPETDAFYATFADGLASPTQEEWLDRLKRYERQRDELTERWEKAANAFLIEQGKREVVERQRDELLEAIANALHDPSISPKSKRPLADAFQSVKGGADV